MRAVRVTESGPPDVLRVEEVDDPAPGPGQVLIGVEAAGVSYGDIIVRSGRYPFPVPYVPGLEAGGTVVAIGPDVDPALLGKRVVATTAGMTGGYAELALAEAAHAHEVPDGLARRTPWRSSRPAPSRWALVVRGPGAARRPGAGHRRRRADRLAAGAVGEGRGRRPGRRAAGGPDKAGPRRTSARTWPSTTRRPTGSPRSGGDRRPRGRRHLRRGRRRRRRPGRPGGRRGGGRFGLYGFTSGTWADLDAHQIGRRGLTVVGALGIIFAGCAGSSAPTPRRPSERRPRAGSGPASTAPSRWTGPPTRTPRSRAAARSAPSSPRDPRPSHLTAPGDDASRRSRAEGASGTACRAAVRGDPSSRAVRTPPGPGRGRRRGGRTSRWPGRGGWAAQGPGPAPTTGPRLTACATVERRSP